MRVVLIANLGDKKITAKLMVEVFAFVRFAE